MTLTPASKHPAARCGALLASCIALAALGACAVPEPPSVSMAEMLQHPGERALADGLRDYENGAFEPAERDFKRALAGGLRDRRDVAVAHKHLAFIACAFNRQAECEADFRQAFTADPDFRLTEAEIGHPVWGPIYRRVAESQAAAGKAR